MAPAVLSQGALRKLLKSNGEGGQSAMLASLARGMH